MASGKDHFKYSLGICAASVPACIIFPELASDIVLGNVLGLLVTNDMDNPSTTYNEHIIANICQYVLRIFGRKKTKAKKDVKVIYKATAAITAPYGVLIPHRSWLSHFPMFSTLTKYGYEYSIYFIITKSIDAIPLSFVELATTHEATILVMIIMDTLHYIMDGGMILFFGKQKYTLGKSFYNLTRKLFPQAERGEK